MRRTLQSFLFSRLNDPNSVTLSSQKRYSSSPIICVATLWTCSNRSMYFLCWGPQSSSWGHESGEDHLPKSAGHISFYADQNIIAFLGCKYTLSVHIHFFLSPSLQGYSQPTHRLHLYQELPRSRCKILHFDLFYMRFMWPLHKEEER